MHREPRRPEADQAPERSGKLLPGMEVRIGRTARLLVRGPLVMKGTRGEPQKRPKRSVPDGWLSTGDVVTADADGYLTRHVTGDIETAVKTSSSVDPRRRRGRSSTLTTGTCGRAAALAKDARIVDIVATAVSGNSRLSRSREQIKRFSRTHHVLGPGGDELTPTMKLRRKPIAEKYASEIAALYADSGRRGRLRACALRIDQRLGGLDHKRSSRSRNQIEFGRCARRDVGRQAQLAGFVPPLALGRHRLGRSSVWPAISTPTGLLSTPSPAIVPLRKLIPAMRAAVHYAGGASCVTSTAESDRRSEHSAQYRPQRGGGERHRARTRSVERSSSGSSSQCPPDSCQPVALAAGELHEGLPVSQIAGVDCLQPMARGLGGIATRPPCTPRRPNATFAAAPEMGKRSASAAPE
ncbi:unnamed protein product, partial [Mesorhabditis spiculigera]